MLGTGNLGKRLTGNDSPKNLYISRDGGLTWRSARPGVYIYEIGDHGSLIVIAKKGKPTNEIEFSLDEGLTWTSLQISEQDIYVENIIIEPNSISQQFIIYGTYAASDSDDGENSQAEKAFLTYADFSSLHTRQCQGVDNAGDASSDFELWTPYDGRHGDDNKCFLGQQVTYTRRKQDSKCYNGEDYERVT